MSTPTSSKTQPEPAAEETAAPERSRHVPALAVGLVTPVLLAVAGYASVSNVNGANSGSLGLVEVLPILYFLIVGALGVSFVLQLRRAETHTAVLVVHVIALVVLLHGVVSWIEQSPRFPVTYTHLGFVEYINRTDHALPSLDARMSWPGFFAMAALLQNVAGTGSAYAFLLWAPLLFNLLYPTLVFAIAKTATTDKRVPWLTVWLFVSISWVGQDYFAPQALNFLFFLAFIAILFRCFRSDRSALPRPLRATGNRISELVKAVLRVPELHPGGPAPLRMTALQQSLLVGGLLLLYGAMAVSHQLTPFFVLLDVTILVILRRTVLRGFPLVMTVIVFSYISYGAIGFWSGHFDDIFGGFGKVSGTVSENVGSKVSTVETNHVLVIYGRLALSAALWFAAGIGFVRRLRKGQTNISFLVCFLAPFLVLGGQSYGGEAILRVFLFSLPFAATFAVFALLPSETIRLNAVRTVVIAVVSIAVVPAFMLSRFGNEQFEYVSKNEYIAAQELYKLAPPGSRLVGVDPNTPWRIKRVEQYDYDAKIDHEPIDDPASVLAELSAKPGKPTYLFISRSQLESNSLRSGRPHNWGDELSAKLLATQRVELLYENPDAKIFKLRPSGNRS